MEQSIPCEKIDGFGVVYFEFILDDHDEFEDGEGFEDQDSRL